MPELRKDPVTGRWIIVSKERSVRPIEFVIPQSNRKFCPFCPGNESSTPPALLTFPRTPGDSWAEGWGVRVVPNQYPALRVEGNLDRSGEGVYDRMNGVGAHEVIIESHLHSAHLAELPIADLQNVLKAYRIRMLDLQRDLRLKYLMVFKNHGALAGATLSHPHSQLIALPVVPHSVQEEMSGARRFYEYRDRCIFCDIIQQEIRDGRRVIFESDRYLCIAPFASRFPFEVWVLPKAHVPDFESSSDEDLRGLAEALRQALGRLFVELHDPPFNYLIHSKPPREDGGSYYHWHLEITPTLRQQVAGFELGSGFYINPTPPEEAAQCLRKADLSRIGETPA
ncbi:MAG: galactose-1-phosphate uridylyltransferase [Bradymonadales bacterium]|nr:galactose-1-phosphate uridylyltransferase [Bradymonadales bacterium]